MNANSKMNVVITQTGNATPGKRPPPGRLKMRQASRQMQSSRPANSCDHANESSHPKQTVIPIRLFKFLTVVSLAIATVAAAPASGPNEFQLVARAGGQARLPCLIGKQALCGEPYFIAWYKLNSTGRQWSRVEARRLTTSEESTAHRPLDRIQFVMPQTGAPAASSCLPHVDNRTTMGETGQQQQLTYSNRQAALTASLGGQKSLAARSFDCGQLTINGLDLIDEGQYKCEITFSDSLDFDSCPASTTTQLNVIARPNEPEISLNGKPIVVGQSLSQTGGSGAASLTFKEGAQVRLECQSAGGKPAPRIEWLNLTSVGSPANSADLNNDQSTIDTRRPPDRVQVQIMRSYWPIKRASYSIPANSLASELSQNNNNQAAAAVASQQRGGAQIPVTSSTITIALSRFDMRSRFACLVVPAQWDQPQHSNGKSYAQATDETARDKNWAGMPEIARNPARLAELLDRTPMLEAPAQRDGEETPGPLLKWIKLDILAKPTSVSMRVLDLAARSLVRPEQPDSLPLAGRHEQQPIYSLHPNRAYAIQCLVEESRPRSQVAWFNRTAPVELEQIELRSSGPDQLIAPQRGSSHRLTSFVQYALQESGAFRTTASLVLTTNFQDNFDEFFCRVSNEAFQFDELAQVAPIISARLHVNYPPTAWLESPGVEWTEQLMGTGQIVGELGQRVQMRCLVGANPVTHNAILAIDWLKDGRRLAAPTASGNSSQQARPLLIEKTNHLHTPLISQTPQLDLANRISASSVDQQQLAAQASRLLAASSLTISSLSKSDAGQYSCQYRLIPMQQQQQQVADSSGSLPTAGPNLSPFQQQQQQQQQMKTITGQANQSIQLNVIEAKLPLVQVASTSGLLVYDKLTPAAGLRAFDAKLDRQNLEVVVIGRRAKIRLRCDLDSANGRHFELGHKVLWQLNGAFLHSSTSELLEIDLTTGQSNDENGELAARLLAGNGGRLTCAHHLLEPGSLQSQNFHSQAMRVLGSSNELDLRLQESILPGQLTSREQLSPVEAKLLQATKQELLMPPLRTFSELELVAQPLNRLRLVCLAQCEPLCTIDWLANGRPVHELHAALAASGGSGELNDASRLVQMREMADNQTQIFKSTRRPGGALLEFENQIHRRTLTSAEHFPWYKQTSLVSGQLQNEPATGQNDLASRQLMRDSYELIQSSGPEAMASNVFSKLELSYNQLSQMLSLVSLAHQDELQLECKLNEFLDGRDKQQGAQTELGVQFGHARVRAHVFYPTRANETLEVLDGFERTHGILRAQLGIEPLNLSALFQEDQQEEQLPRINRFQTRVTLEKSLKSDSSAFASGNFPILLSPQLATPNSSHFQHGPLDNLQTPRGPTPSPMIRNWLANHLDLVVVVASSVALVWLLSLFVSPLMRRHFFARSPSSTVNMLKQKRAIASDQGHHLNWPRFNPPNSRASSANEIGLFGNSAYKFSGGGGGISAPNYYGAPDSAGGDSSEHDMVQSSSQSSHYEDFIQHQLAQQQRLGAHQHQQQQQQQLQQVVQPLYFNQAHLVESTTLSRRPLMKSSYSSSSAGGDTSGSSGAGSRAPLAASRIYGDIRQLQQQQQQQHPMPSFAATMRHSAQSQVQPLISNSTCVSSRINFSDLQRHRQQEQHAGPQTFGKPPTIPLGQHRGRTHNEHIYDDVS